MLDTNTVDVLNVHPSSSAYIRPPKNTHMADQQELDAHYTTMDKIFRLSLGEKGGYSGARFDGDFSMTLEQAQARDWLIFLQSSLYNLGLESGRLDAALRSVLERELPQVRRVLAHAARRLSWLRHLPTNRNIWGKDFVSLQAVGAAMFRHHQNTHQSP